MPDKCEVKRGGGRLVIERVEKRDFFWNAVESLEGMR